MIELGFDHYSWGPVEIEEKNRTVLKKRSRGSNEKKIPISMVPKTTILKVQSEGLKKKICSQLKNVHRRNMINRHPLTVKFIIKCHHIYEGHVYCFHRV